FRANLKNKRKLSLPVFINQFQAQWAEKHGGSGGNVDRLDVSDGGSSRGSNFGSLTSIPQTVDRESHRRGSSSSRAGLTEFREKLHSGGLSRNSSGGSGGSSGSPYSTLSPSQRLHAHLGSTHSSPAGGVMLRVPRTPPYHTSRISWE
ncbi:unnamed protein product, partial [Meganyctiphanes norvegica]